MKNLKEKAGDIFLVTNLWIIILGGGLMYYWAFIDAIVFPPLTMHVDPRNLQTDKPVYKSGDVVRVYTAFCKNRPGGVISNWSLVDTIVRTYPTKQYELAKGCYGSAQEPVLVEVVTLPPEMPNDTYHLKSVTRVRINPLKEVITNYRTTEFEIIN